MSSGTYTEPLNYATNFNVPLLIHIVVCSSSLITTKMKGFYYKGMKFIEVSHNIFHSEKFGDKLIYEYKNDNYHLVKDERLSSVIGLDEINSNPNSICNNDYWWK